MRACTPHTHARARRNYMNMNMIPVVCMRTCMARRHGGPRMLCACTAHALHMHAMTCATARRAGHGRPVGRARAAQVQGASQVGVQQEVRAEDQVLALMASRTTAPRAGAVCRLVTLHPTPPLRCVHVVPQGFLSRGPQKSICSTICYFLLFFLPLAPPWRSFCLSLGFCVWHRCLSSPVKV